MNPVLWYVLWLAIAMTFFFVVGGMFVQDMGRFLRGEPLRIPFVGEAQPGDLTYPLALMELFGPYVTVAAVTAFFVASAVYLTAFAG